MNLSNQPYNAKYIDKLASNQQITNRLFENKTRPIRWNINRECTYYKPTIFTQIKKANNSLLRALYWNGTYPLTAKKEAAPISHRATPIVYVRDTECGRGAT